MRAVRVSDGHLTHVRGSSPALDLTCCREAVGRTIACCIKSAQSWSAALPCTSLMRLHSLMVQGSMR